VAPEQDRRRDLKKDSIVTGETQTVDHEERLFTGYTGRISLTLGLGWATVRLGRQVIPPLLPTITDQLAITSSQAGFALTLMWGLYAMVHYPGGRYSDQLSRQTILIVGLVVMIVGFAVLANVVSYLFFVTGVTLVGVGAGLFFVPMRALLADLFVERRGWALGFNLGVGMIGSVVAAGLAIVVLRVASWQAAFLPIIAILVAVGLALERWNRERYSFGWVPLNLRGVTRRVFGSSEIRRLVLAYSLWAFTFQAVTAFLPTFLQANGLSTEIATGGFALMFVVASVVMPISGNFGDRFGHIPIAVGSVALAAVGLGWMLLVPGSLTVLLAIVVFATGLMAYPPVMQAYVMDVFPSGDVGGDFGAFKTVYTVLGSLGPMYVGVVVDQAGFSLAFGGAVICLLLGAGLTFVVLRQ